MAIRADGAHHAPGGRRVRHLVLGAVAGAALLLAAAIVAAQGGLDRPAAAGASGPAPGGALPTFGAPRAIEVHNRLLNDVGDPYVLPVPAGVDGMAAPGYVLYWTTDWWSNVPTAVSTDLVHWRRVADSLPTLPSWAVVDHPPPGWGAGAGVSTLTWGPTVHQVGDRWVMYYATGDRASGRECIGAATAGNPTGPFVDASSAPLVCQAALGGDIDPSVVVPRPGELALVWKNDGNAAGVPVGIWEQPLSADGLTATGTPTRLLGADQAWEHGIVEGPAMLADTRGGWWLFYSGGTWQSDTYDTGVAWCATVAGPCRQPTATPVLASTAGAVSPGGLDTFVAHDGRLWASYSAFPSRPADAQAAMASPRVLELTPVLSH